MNRQIKCYPPEDSLVLLPEKLQEFYVDTRIPTDPYPWQCIFHPKVLFLDMTDLTHFTAYQ